MILPFDIIHLITGIKKVHNPQLKTMTLSLYAAYFHAYKTFAANLALTFHDLVQLQTIMSKLSQM